MSSNNSTNIDKEVRVRAAPSPTGRVHVGNLRTFFYNYLFSKKHGGSYVLRIEDTDQTRKVDKGMEGIVEALKLYGITFDEGPGMGGDHGPYIQSKRLDLYKKYAEELVDKGAAYYCFCSSDRLEKLREEQLESGLKPKYDRKCRELDIEEARQRIEDGESYVIRLKVPLKGETFFDDIIYGRITTQNKEIGDQILLKSDGFPTYHLAVVVDDHLMEISHIMRASEWMPSTPKHIIMYDAFGWEPPKYAHVPMILNPDGPGKLSKRKGALPAIAYLRKGYLQEAVLNYFSLVGWAPSPDKAKEDEIYTVDELIELFDINRIHKAGGRYNPEKLEAINSKHIRRLSVSELVERIFNWVDGLVLKEFISDRYDETLDWEEELREEVKKYAPKWKEDKDYFEKLIPLFQDRLMYLGELPDLMAFFYDDELEYKREELEEFGDGDRSEALKGAWDRLEDMFEQDWDHDKWEQTIRDYADELGWKHGQLFMLIRVAVTGRKASPPLFECMKLMGHDKCESYFSQAIKFLK